VLVTGRRILLVLSIVALMAPVALAAPSAGAAGSARPAPSGHEGGRYIVSGADAASVKSAVAKAGGAVAGTLSEDLHQIAATAVTVNGATADKLAANPKVKLARSHARRLVLPEGAAPTHRDHPKGKPMAIDPANNLDGLFWNFDRIKSPQANAITLGRADVVVGVADTGLDFTHSELKGKIAGQKDFTVTENPPACAELGEPSDAENAAANGGPVNTDWNGHGTWIGGNIAANLEGLGINGIAPRVQLFDLKVSQGCGSANDDSLIAAILYAADNGMDVISISFGGYADRSDPEQDAIYTAYADAVAYATRKGTLVVVAAGNEHVRIGAGGQVLSHGQLTVPGDPLEDLYGLWELPGGVPGAVMVSATGNITRGASDDCAADDVTAGVCKPKTDAHQPVAVGSKDQLAYYSNYGPRIDVAAPGGARKFNLPNADRGGTPGFPDSDAEGTVAYQEFSITSNWALDVPCTKFTEGPFFPGECYSSIQGTSMSTPHVAAVAALIASRYGELRHKPTMILNLIKHTARGAQNYTPALSATDMSAGDRTGIECPTGYCHLGGPAVSSHDAYGAGIVDAYAAVVEYDSEPDHNDDHRRKS
jgi:lantibiotic leader peptide-processing serine protease